jgi:hypothetical protein
LKISKGGTDKKENTCPYGKMKKSKWGTDKNEKNPSHPCMKMKISKGGTDKKENACPYVKMEKNGGQTKMKKQERATVTRREAKRFPLPSPLLKAIAM